MLIALGLIMEHIQVAAKDQARRKLFDQPGITLNIAIALTGPTVECQFDVTPARIRFSELRLPCGERIDHATCLACCQDFYQFRFIDS